MNKKPIEPLGYNLSAAVIRETGISQDMLNWLAPRLEAARIEVLDDLALWQSGSEVPRVKEPLDAGFIDLPERMLGAYAENGAASELGQIIATGEHLASHTDRLVVLGIGGSYMGARAIFEACCHPYHNELSRAERGKRPRIYFEGNNLDNDAVAGLVELIESEPKQRWGIIVISKSGGTLETAVGFRIFLDVMRRTYGEDVAKFNSLVVPVTGEKSRLRSLCTALGCPQMFPIPDGVGGRFSILTAVGLLPAAAMGVDVVRLLEGAAEMNRCFCNSPPSKNQPGKNPVLDYVATCHLMETRRGANTRVLSAWGKGMEAMGLWYDQLLAESLGKDGQGALPLTTVNTRDLHSRGQQHQQGRRDKLITNLVVGSHKRDPIAVKASTMNQDRLNELSGKTLPEILKAAEDGTNRAYADDHRPTTEIRLPALEEGSLGQFFQMMMLATVVEGRLIGINPYGQPGVEAYKKHMIDFLSRK